jgi:phage repressor protein C with HTH and peptisase S24 domain
LVVCINDGEALIKKIQKGDKGPILVSLNPKYPPFFADEDFRIVGKVMGFIGYASEH